MRHYSRFDEFVMQADTALRTLFGGSHTSGRRYPAEDIPDTELSASDRRHVAALMRVNHSGEVAAQGLYQGQSLTCRNAAIRDKLREAAIEENDHLLWTSLRLKELGSHTSYLSPLWYAGSVTIGATAGAIGDKWNLGFLAETEHQVVEHLESHFARLPDNDARSRTIIEQMQVDEAKHADTAIEYGAAELPLPARKLMKAVARVMTGSAYYI